MDGRAGGLVGWMSGRIQLWVVLTIHTHKAAATGWLAAKWSRPCPCSSLLPCALQDNIADLRLMPTTLDSRGIPEQSWKRPDICW